MYISCFAYQFIFQWTLGCFHVCAIMNNTVMNMGIQISLQTHISIILGTYPEVELLDLFLIFWRTFSSRSFMASDIFKSSIHFKLILWVMWNRGPIYCWACFSNFPRIICWRDYPFPIRYSWLPFLTLIDYICQGLILGSLFCSTDWCVYFCASSILFLLL